MSDTEPPRTFEVYAVGDAFRCDLVLGDGRLLLRSERLETVAEGTALVEQMRAKEAVLRPRMTANGEFYFTIERAGKVLATSPREPFPADRDAAVELAKAAVSTAVIVFVDQPTAQS